MIVQAPLDVPPDELPVVDVPVDGLVGDASDPHAPAMAAPPTAVIAPIIARRLKCLFVWFMQIRYENGGHAHRLSSTRHTTSQPATP